MWNMASWSETTKHEPSSINGGQRYESGDRVSREQLNSLAENSFYAVNKSDIANANSENALAIANDAFEQSKVTGTQAYVGGEFVSSLSFGSDPQTQIDNKMDLKASQPFENTPSVMINMFDYDKQNWSVGVLSDNGTVYTSNNNYRTTDFMDFMLEGETYIVSFKQTYVSTPASDTSNRICFYDSNKSFIGVEAEFFKGYTTANSATYSRKVKVPVGAKYVRYSVRVTDENISIGNAQNIAEVVLKPELLDLIFPIHAIYTADVDISPSGRIGGTWERLPEGYALWTTETEVNNEGEGVDTAETKFRKIPAGLPNLKGTFPGADIAADNVLFKDEGKNSSPVGSGSGRFHNYSFNASRYNSIYSDNINTVQSPAYKLFAWKRLA